MSEMSTRNGSERRVVLLSAADLVQKGIRLSRPQRDRLIRAGKFPRPVKLGLKSNAWVESEIDSYLEGLIAARDSRAA